MENMKEKEYKINMWIDKIASEEIVLTNGEYSIIFRHNGKDTGRVNNLPKLFQNTTIVDTFEIEFKKKN